MVGILRNAQPKWLFKGWLQRGAILEILKNYHRWQKFRCKMGLQWVATGLLSRNYASDQNCDIRVG